jgi:hypothetical protein
VRQLRDRDWAYRRSGLFGTNKESGSIPVALTLQQIETVLHFRKGVFATGMHLTSGGAGIQECESDIVILHEGYGAKLEVAIGECKSRGGIIDEHDIRRLSSVARAFPSDRVDCFVVFAKTGSFSTEEIARCQSVQRDGKVRVILLSEQELEPYHVYERTSKELSIRATAISLGDMARITTEIFFQPRKHKQVSIRGVLEPEMRAEESRRRSKYTEVPIDDLRTVYEFHNAPSARDWPVHKQCQCSRCSEYRAKTILPDL